jgi:hypothetical protein
MYPAINAGIKNKILIIFFLKFSQSIAVIIAIVTIAIFQPISTIITKH